MLSPRVQTPAGVVAHHRRGTSATFAAVCLLLPLAAATPGPAAAAQPGKPADSTFLRSARQAIAQGRYSDAESLARSRGASDHDAAGILGRLLAHKGRYEDAEAVLAPAAKAGRRSEAALELGLLYMTLGRKGEARALLAPLVDAAADVRTPDAYLRGGRAAQALRQARSADSLLRSAQAAARDDAAMETAWGELFLEKFAPGDAAASFQAALKLDPKWAPAHLGLAWALEAENPPAALTAARKALEIDPALVEAHLFVAQSALDNDRVDEARGAVRQALGVNPRHLEALSLQAAFAWLGDQPEEFEKRAAAVLDVNPSYGNVFRITAAQAARKYRFEEAAVLARRALALERDNTRAYADLGLHLLRTGDEREARRALETAFESDRYDIVTYNLLTMLDTLDGFASVKAGDAVLRLHPDEAPVLRHYAAPMVQEAMAQMSKRYGVTPKGPVLVQVFPKHDDFAVRTLGIPGLLGALGASFGRVVTMDSPRARQPGSFNWQATLWHELAHVFTLYASKQRVPRWLTEGVSVYEEGLLRHEYARDSEMEFARAYGAGQVPKLEALNAGFTNPATIGLAYYQSSLVVSMIVERYGYTGLNKLLAAYGEGLETDAALKKAMGVGFGDLQEAFDAKLASRFGELGEALRVPEGFEPPKEKNAATITALADKYPGSYPVQMSVGQVLASDPAARSGAVRIFERAAKLVPTATGPASPRARLAELLLQQGDESGARRYLKSLLADDHTNVEAARRLAALAEKANDEEARALAYERIVTIDPFDARAHTEFGKIAQRRGDLTTAVREFQAAVAAGPVDVAAARCDLGEALLQAGRPADAKREVLAALEIAPTYARAQDLLLKIVEREGP